MSIGRFMRNVPLRRWLFKLGSNPSLRRLLNHAAFGRLVIAIRIGKVVNLLRFMFWAVSSITSRRRKNGRVARLTRWKTPLRGKRGLNPREKTESSVFRWNLYFHVLRLSWLPFLMCMAGTYFVTSMIFASLYYLDVDGLHVETKTDWPAWVETVLPSTGRSVLTVFLYSCSISTSFSQSNVDAHSLYTLALGNVHALVVQLISVFWCSALCERISQPVKVVRWSTVGVISGDSQSSTLAGINSPENNYRVLALRFDLLGAYTTGLVDAKFDVMCLNSSLSSQLLSRELTLVRKEASSITRGALLQHIIDESSPLYGCDMEVSWDMVISQMQEERNWLECPSPCHLIAAHITRNRLADVSRLQAMGDGDYIFEVSVRAVEKTTMRQVFSEHHYSVHDGEILWDREFEDQIYSDEDGNSVYDYTLLDSVRALEDSRYILEATPNSEMKSEVGGTAERGNRKIWRFWLWLALQSAQLCLAG